MTLPADIIEQLVGRSAIVTGGTGLYLTALTRGLAWIPPVPEAIRARGMALLEEPDGLARLLADLDASTADGIDRANPVRVLRAWEVLHGTGRGLAEWQAETGPPLIAPDDADCVVLQADRDWLAARIERRFAQMLQQGALDEVRALAGQWDPSAQWARAIGAAELMGHLEGRLSMEEATRRAVIATRRYAKSQRSWFRNRMADWQLVSAEGISPTS